MKRFDRVVSAALLSLFGVLGVTWMLQANSADDEAVPQKRAKKVIPVEDKNRVPLEVAKDRARLMHDIYDATLDVIHHRYFHRDKVVIPARAMEDVFSHMQRQSNVEAKWISVNLKAMSIDHEPETEFEKQAAREIASGKTEFDAVEEGYYRRAGMIPLTAGCVSCHAGFFRDATQTPRYAALVISVPIVTEAPAEK